jgi:hypothetical protein
MSDNAVIVSGSGASRASGFLVNIQYSVDGNVISKDISPPTNQEFFDVIPDTYIKNNYPALWCFKNIYYPPSHNKSMEDVWTDVDINHKHITLDTYAWSYEKAEYLQKYRTKYPLSDINNNQFMKDGLFGNSTVFTTSPVYNRYKLLGDCGRDFRSLVYKIYSNYTKAAGVDIYKNLHAAFRGSKYRNVSYLTFNYDCYIEESLLGEPLKYVGVNDRTDSYEALIHGGIPIIKLHGSLSWEYSLDGTRDNVTYRAFPYTPESQVAPRYDGDKQWCEPAIIPPTIFKQEINDDLRFSNQLTKTILQQWRAAITLLTEADFIIIAGYSFPISDHHVARLFRISSMIRYRKGLKQSKILYCCGPEDDTEKMKSKIYDIYGATVDVVITKGFEKIVECREFRSVVE